MTKDASWRPITLGPGAKKEGRPAGQHVTAAAKSGGGVTLWCALQALQQHGHAGDDATGPNKACNPANGISLSLSRIVFFVVVNAYTARCDILREGGTERK